MYNIRRAKQFSSLTSKLRVSNNLKCRVRPLSTTGQDDTTRSTSSGNRLQFPPLPREWETKYVPGQMYKYQNTLPKLPVPPLKQTLDKFMSSVEPLLSEDKLEKTKALTADFGKAGGVGERLQTLLEKRAKEEDNWLFEWRPLDYLGKRLPLVFHQSPGLAFYFRSFPPLNSTDQQARLAAIMILSILKFNLLVQHEAIPPDVFKKPMCMYQYDMFSKCRIPCPEVDKIRHTPIADSRHVIVMRNGHIFKLDVLYECFDGTLAVAPSSHVVEQLHSIIKMTSDLSTCPVGILTSERRDTWTECRERLLIEPTNCYSLDVIERAQFVICLDKAHPQILKQIQSSSSGSRDLQDYHRNVLATNALHGNGSHCNSCNRWFDHGLQISVDETGGIGTLMEHSSSDGPIGLVLTLFILDMIDSLGYDILGEPSPTPVNALLPAEKLQWKLSPDTVQDIAVATKNLNKLVDEVDHQILTFEDFGKDCIAAFKISPHGFIQLAIQLAYYRLHGHPCASSSRGTTRWFLKGRTDYIRSCTNTSLAFVKAMEDPETTAQTKSKLLKTAINEQSHLAVETMKGQAIDRYFVGLRMIAKEAGVEIHDFFKDEGFLKSLHYNLNTSQMPVADYDIYLSFGHAVIPDGYGVSFDPKDDWIRFTVSSFRSCAETEPTKYCAILVECLRDMRDLLSNTSCGPN